jgi:hypothetical protein
LARNSAMMRLFQSLASAMRPNLVAAAP